MSGKRLTTKDFIEKAVIKHGNRYDYSKVKYTGIHLKVDIICKTHGVFSQEANVHLRGANCPKCSSLKTKHKLKLSTQEFIQKAVSIRESTATIALSIVS